MNLRIALAAAALALAPLFAPSLASACAPPPDNIVPETCQVFFELADVPDCLEITDGAWTENQRHVAVPVSNACETPITLRCDGTGCDDTSLPRSGEPLLIEAGEQLELSVRCFEPYDGPSELSWSDGDESGMIPFNVDAALDWNCGLPEMICTAVPGQSGGHGWLAFGLLGLVALGRRRLRAR